MEGLHTPQAHMCNHAITYGLQACAIARAPMCIVTLLYLSCMLRPAPERALVNISFFFFFAMLLDIAVSLIVAMPLYIAALSHFREHLVLLLIIATYCVQPCYVIICIAMIFYIAHPREHLVLLLLLRRVRRHA